MADEISTPTEATKPAPMIMSTVIDARGRFLRTKEPRTEFVVVDGAEVALAMPTEGQRGDINAASVDIDKGGRVSTGNFAKRRAVTVIAMVHTIVVDPTTGSKRKGAPIFSDVDLPLLMAEPSGDSVIEMFGPKCEALLAKVDGEALDRAKNA
jgi:hypothetical protein